MHPPIPRHFGGPDGAIGKHVSANRALRMENEVSRDSRWRARLLPEPIRIIGPHFARAGYGSHHGAISQKKRTSVPKKRATGGFVGKQPRHPPPTAPWGHRRFLVGKLQIHTSLVSRHVGSRLRRRRQHHRRRRPAPPTCARPAYRRPQRLCTVPAAPGGTGPARAEGFPLLRRVVYVEVPAHRPSLWGHIFFSKYTVLWNGKCTGRGGGHFALPSALCPLPSGDLGGSVTVASGGVGGPRPPRGTGARLTMAARRWRIAGRFRFCHRWHPIGPQDPLAHQLSIYAIK
eukprot:gene12098-biopygen15471